MKDNEICSRVSKRLRFNKSVVEEVFKEIVNEMMSVLETEEPILIRGFGEFYFRYQKEASHDPVKKSLKFRAVGYASELLEKKSACIGIKSTDSLTLAQSGVRAEDVPMIRKIAHSLQVKNHLELRKFEGLIDLQQVSSSIDKKIQMLEEGE